MKLKYKTNRKSAFYDRENEAIDLKNSGLSSQEIANYFNTSVNVVQRFFSKQGLPFPRRRYEYNDRFFENIDCESKAYFLGFLYADGNITISKRFRKKTVRLQLQESDSEILEKLMLVVGCSKPVSYSGGIGTVELTGTKIVSDLNKHGLHPNKTFTLKFPTFIKNDNLVRHFIRGYFDGDGGICLYESKRSTRKVCCVSFTGLDSFCESIQNILEDNLGIRSKFYVRFPKRNNNIGSFTIGGNRQAQKLLDYLYKDSLYYLDRKFRKYKELCLINL